MRTKLIAALTLAAVCVVPAWAQTGAAVVADTPGKVAVAQTVDLTASITAIDAAKRLVTLKGPENREVTVVAGPDVKNFDQLKVGDKVDIQFMEALVLELKKGGGKPVARTEKEAMAASKAGSTPGAAGGRQVTIVGDVIAVDPATQKVTVKGPERTVDLKVRDPAQFKLIAKGDQIEATYTEAVAISVRPSAKK